MELLKVLTFFVTEMRGVYLDVVPRINVFSRDLGNVIFQVLFNPWKIGIYYFTFLNKGKAK